jgi:acetoin utilization deacetylase AcuC-like enzyme
MSSETSAAPRAAPSRRVVSVDDALFDQHRPPGHHPERPERLHAARRAVGGLSAAGVTATRLAARDASDAEILRAHAPPYLEELGRLAGHASALDPDTYVAPASVAAARRAAGAAIVLVESILEAPSPGVALLRPPGHHATRATGMGFCLLNNVAIAAYAALARGLSRVAIVDWDVHHGNGTQDIFWRDPRVLFLSLHQYPFYPGTGARGEVGEGDGAGYTVNVPLAQGATDAVYARAFEAVVEPVLRRFAPDLLLVSAGFDAHERDPLASMRLTEAGFAFMARRLSAIARETAGGRIAFLLEGGYDLEALEGSLAATLEAAAGAGPNEGEDVGGEGTARRGPAGAIDGRHAAEIAEARKVAAIGWPGV